MPSRLVLIVCVVSLTAWAEASARVFPVVEPQVQAVRDDARREVLEDELLAEQQKLLAAQALLARSGSSEHAADVHRRTENVKAIQREIGATKSAQETSRPVAKAKRPTPKNPPHHPSGSASFWNPYNRTPAVDAPGDFSLPSRKE